LNTSSLSSLGAKANLTPPPLEGRFISEAFHQGSGPSLGGVQDAISVKAESKITGYPKRFRAQA
jgi:hypothetical protein